MTVFEQLDMIEIIRLLYLHKWNKKAVLINFQLPN